MGHGTASSFTGTAAAGGFAVSPEVGSALKTAITTALDDLDQARQLLGRIKEGTPLGESPAGLAMAKHNLAVVTGGQDTGEQALHDLTVALEQHRAAIDQAMAHYVEQERGNMGGFQ